MQDQVTRSLASLCVALPCLASWNKPVVHTCRPSASARCQPSRASSPSPHNTSITYTLHLDLNSSLSSFRPCLALTQTHHHQPPPRTRAALNFERTRRKNAHHDHGRRLLGPLVPLFPIGSALRRRDRGVDQEVYERGHSGLFPQVVGAAAKGALATTAQTIAVTTSRIRSGRQS